MERQSWQHVKGEATERTAGSTKPHQRATAVCEASCLDIRVWSAVEQGVYSLAIVTKVVNTVLCEDGKHGSEVCTLRLICNRNRCFWPPRTRTPEACSNGPGTVTTETPPTAYVVEDR